jgi:hypothetical protein
LWASGFETISSCQDAAEDLESFAISKPHMRREVEYLRGYSYVDFDVKSGLASLDAIANAGPRDAFYVRMVHWAAPGAWQVSIRPDDVAADDETLPSRFGFWMLKVAFPKTDLDEIIRRLTARRRGYVARPGPVDWTSVEITDEHEAGGVSPSARPTWPETILSFATWGRAG